MKSSKSIEQNKRLRNLRLPILASGSLVTAITVILYIVNPNFIRLIDNKLYDLSMQIALSQSDSSGKPEPSKSVSTGQNIHPYQQVSVIVDIDEYSLSKFGQWPWSRYYLSELLNKIHDAGAIGIGIDIVFAEPDRTSPVVIQRSLKENFNIDVTFSNITSDLMDNDLLLAKAINRTSSTLGYYFNFKRQSVENNKSLQNQKGGQQNSHISVESSIPPLSANISFQPGTDPDAIFRYIFNGSDILSPIPVLLSPSKNKYAGFMNTLADSDGVLRRTPLFISWNGKIYPQLALATLISSMRQATSKAKTNPVLKNTSNTLTEINEEPLIKISSNGVESIQIGNTLIPLEANGSMLLNYRGPAHTFKYISAGKILESMVDKEDLTGKIVFLGSSAAGLKDIRMSPLDYNFPGVEVHATIVDNIIRGDFISRPDWAFAFEVILTILCGIITTILIGWSGPWTTLVLTIVIGQIIFFASVFALNGSELNNYPIWISSLSPLIILAANFSILNLVKYGIAEKDKKFYRSAFGHYVSKSVVNQIIESPETFSLDGEEKEITILFSDIRNFSSISETLSPSQVSRLLHEYFTPATKMVIDNQGTLDKFIGDAMMCFWNAPVNVENHKSLALNAAIKILAALDDLSKIFEKEYGVQIKTGIGLHSGVCRVGNMGSADLFDYTAIGDHVNTASRLEGLTKFYGADLIFSESMIPEKQEDILVQYVDRVRVKGKSEPINIYTIHRIEAVGDCDYMRSGLERYHHAVELYRKRDFKAALEIFSELEGRKSGSTKLYSIYRQRALEFMNIPPDNGWDGVFNHTSK